MLRLTINLTLGHKLTTYVISGQFNTLNRFDSFKKIERRLSMYKRFRHYGCHTVLWQGYFVGGWKNSNKLENYRNESSDYFIKWIAMYNVLTESLCIGNGIIWASWCLVWNLMQIGYLFSSFLKLMNKKHQWFSTLVIQLWQKPTGDWWIPLTKGSVMGKPFIYMLQCMVKLFDWWEFLPVSDANDSHLAHPNKIW